MNADELLVLKNHADALTTHTTALTAHTAELKENNTQLENLAWVMSEVEKKLESNNKALGNLHPRLHGLQGALEESN